MRYRELFMVYPRRMRSGLVVFYFQTYDEAGKRLSARSTGARNARDARLYCMKLYKAGLLGVASKRVPTMGEFSKGWWNLETCEYLKSRMARRKITTSYARQGKRILDTYILPAFKAKRLDEITSHVIDAWMVSSIERGLAPKSVNLMLSILRVMLGVAVKKGFLKVNPCDLVERVTVEKSKVEILRPEEVRELFDPKKALKLWSNELNYGERG